MLIGRHLCNSTQKRVFLSKLSAEGGFPARNDNAHAGAWRRVREWRRRGIGSLPEHRHGGWVAPSSACGLPRGTRQGSQGTGYARQAGRLRYVTQASRLPRAPSRSRCAAKRTPPSSWPRNRCKMLIGRHLCSSTKKRVFLSKLPAEAGFPAAKNIRPSSWLRNRCKMLIGRHLRNSTQKRVFLSKLSAEGGFPARNDNAHAGAWRRVREWRRRGIGSLPKRRYGGWVAPSSACGLPRGTRQGSTETGYARQAGRLRYVTQASRLPRAPSRSRCAAKRTPPSSWPRNRCKMLSSTKKRVFLSHLCSSTKKRVFLSKFPAKGGFPARNDIAGVGGCREVARVTKAEQGRLPTRRSHRWAGRTGGLYS